VSGAGTVSEGIEIVCGRNGRKIFPRVLVRAKDGFGNDDGGIELKFGTKCFQNGDVSIPSGVTDNQEQKDTRLSILRLEQRWL
jgi:hypothetical protein